MSTISSSEIKDKKTGIFTSLGVLFIIFILLYINTIENSITKINSITLITDIPLETIEEFKDANPVTQNGGGGGGGGTPSNDKVDPTPKPQTDQNVTSKSSTSSSMSDKGMSNKNTSDNSNNTATSTKKSNNPFGDGGDGSGSGGGVGKGKGIGFGPDNGSGNGPGNGGGTGGGTGDGAARIRLIDPKVDNINSDANHKIVLRVKIDEDGNVISTQNTSRTTTTDQTLISEVREATKNQAKYKKKPGAGIEEAFITITIRAK
jgi:hypothetical protein